MGDAGAYFLGFYFAFLGLIGKISFNMSLVAPIILMGASNLQIVYAFWTIRRAVNTLLKKL